MSTIHLSPLPLMWLNPSNLLLRLHLYKAQGRQTFENHCCVAIHWIALAENSQMSTHLPGFQSFFRGFLHHFLLATLATSSKRVNHVQSSGCAFLSSAARPLTAAAAAVRPCRKPCSRKVLHAYWTTATKHTLAAHKPGTIAIASWVLYNLMHSSHMITSNMWFYMSFVREFFTVVNFGHLVSKSWRSPL